MRLALVVATLLVTSVLLACGPGDDAPVGIPNTCVVNANYPHASHHVAGNINAVVSIKCGELMSSVTVHVGLDRKDTFGWTSIGTDSKTFSPLRANQKGQQNLAVPCADGTYRTNGYAEIVGDQEAGKSQEYHSKEVAIHIDKSGVCIDDL